MREVVAAVREATDLVVQLSTGGAVTDPFDARLAVLDAEPDAASLTLGTVNFGRDVFSNPWDLIVELHTQMQQRGIVPEYEVFDLGQLATLARLLDRYGPPHGGHVHVDLVMGVPGGMPGTAQALTACLPLLPPGATFAATGVGPDVAAGDARRAVGRRPPPGGHGGHAHLRSGRAGARQRPAGRPRGRARPHRPAPAADAPTTPDACWASQHDGGRTVSPKPAPAGGAAVDALLEPAFLENAMRSPMTEVRQLRRQAEQEEVNLSYTRRLLQGRLDIVRRELQRRAEHDGRSLVDLLPEILAEKGRGPAHGLGRHQTVQPSAPGGVRVLGQRADAGASTCPRSPTCPTPSWRRPPARWPRPRAGCRSAAAACSRSWTGWPPSWAAATATARPTSPRCWPTRAGTEPQPAAAVSWPDNPVLVEVWRSGFLESVHRGALVVLDADGAVPSRPGRSTGRCCRGRRTSRCRRPRCSRPAGRRARGRSWRSARGRTTARTATASSRPAMLAGRRARARTTSAARRRCRCTSRRAPRGWPPAGRRSGWR